MEMLHSAKTPGRILAVTIGGLGDAVLFSPVLRALRSRYPQAEIELLVASRLAQITYSHAREIDRVVFVDTNHPSHFLKILAMLPQALKWRAQGGFDIGVFATGLNPWLRIFLKFATGIQNIVYAPKPPAFETDLACNVALARRFDEKTGESDVFIPLTENARDEAIGVLKKHGISWDKHRIIEVYPSTELWRRPRWDLSKLAEVIYLLKENTFQGKVVVLGSHEEGKEWENCDRRQVADVNLAGRLSIAGSAWVLSKCCLAICNDGGLMHVAGAVGCPGVVVMPNAPMTYRPPGYKIQVIRPKLSCAAACYPQRPRKCKVAKCKDDITVEEVVQACLDFLKETKSKRLIPVFESERQT